MAQRNWIFYRDGLQYLPDGEEHLPTSKSIQAFLKGEPKMSEGLNQRAFRIEKSQNFRKRISHWVKEGLINENRENEKGWRNLSFVELIWLSILTTLRDVGYSYDAIRQIKKSVCEVDGCGDSEYPILEYGFFCAYHCSDPTFLAVLPDNSAELVDGKNLSFSLLQPHLHFIRSLFLLSLNGIVGFLLDPPTIFLKGVGTVSIAESQLLDFLKEYDFDEMLIKTKGGRMDLMEGTFTEKTTDLTSRDIEQRRRKHSHQKIELSQFDHEIKEVKSKIQRRIKD